MKKFVTALLLACGVASAADLTGAGATFPYPIYAKWAEAYKAATGIGLNYQSIGSGGGIRQIKAKTVDFGASDMPIETRRTGKRRSNAISSNHRWCCSSGKS
jgi:phosphate transport system substrate-binding protein